MTATPHFGSGTAVLSSNGNGEGHHDLPETTAAPEDTPNGASSRRAAVKDWQDAAAAGRQPPTGAELARRYGMSPSWGRAVARHARLTLTANHPPDAPDAPPNEPPTGSTGAPGGRTTPTTDRVAPPDEPAGAPDGRHARTTGRAEATPGDTATAAASAVAAAAPEAAATVRTRAEGEPAWVRVANHASLLLVVIAAAVASVDHLAEVARLAGTTGWKVWLLPASVDGLAIAAAVTVYRAQCAGRSAGAVAWLALAAGVAVSVAGNVIAVYPELVPIGQLKVAVGAIPPLSLALAIHLTLGPTHR